MFWVEVFNEKSVKTRPINYDLFRGTFTRKTSNCFWKSRNFLAKFQTQFVEKCKCFPYSNVQCDEKYVQRKIKILVLKKYWLCAGFNVSSFMYFLQHVCRFFQLFQVKALLMGKTWRSLTRRLPPSPPCTKNLLYIIITNDNGCKFLIELILWERCYWTPL